MPRGNCANDFKEVAVVAYHSWTAISPSTPAQKSSLLPGLGWWMVSIFTLELLVSLRELAYASRRLRRLSEGVGVVPRGARQFHFGSHRNQFFPSGVIAASSLAMGYQQPHCCHGLQILARDLVGNLVLGSG